MTACNPSGCTPSNEVSIDGEQLAAMGYLKPDLHAWFTYYGNRVAVSADGKTIAVMATEEIGSFGPNATVNVYRKTTASSGWHAEAILRGYPVQVGGGLGAGDELAISADGNVIALGAWTEDTAGAGTGPDDPSGEYGAVYLFRFIGGHWQQTQRISGENRIHDRFGYVVKLDDAGRMLVISHQRPGGRSEPGTLEIYRDPVDASNEFVHSASVPIPKDAEGNGFCEGVALSGDGKTLLRGCAYAQVLNAPDFSESARLEGAGNDGMDLSYDGTQAIVQLNGSAVAWKLGPTGWVTDGVFPNNNGPIGGQRYVSISRDGKIAAVGHYTDFTAGLGPVYPPYTYVDENAGTGGVFVYQRKSSGWVLRRLVKPDSTSQGWAGWSVALGDNGRILVVGAPVDPSVATGIDGDRSDTSVPNRGAVWVY